MWSYEYVCVQFSLHAFFICLFCTIFAVALADTDKLPVWLREYIETRMQIRKMIYNWNMFTLQCSLISGRQIHCHFYLSFPFFHRWYHFFFSFFLLCRFVWFVLVTLCYTCNKITKKKNYFIVSYAEWLSTSINVVFVSFIRYGICHNLSFRCDLDIYNPIAKKTPTILFLLFQLLLLIFLLLLLYQCVILWQHIWLTRNIVIKKLLCWNNRKNKRKKNLQRIKENFH